MARFQIEGRIVACNACGNDNLFEHAPQLLTCNKCGNTFETVVEVKPLIEQVVTAYHDQDK